jgi:hypothetical protein
MRNAAVALITVSTLGGMNKPHSSMACAIAEVIAVRVAEPNDVQSGPPIESSAEPRSSDEAQEEYLAFWHTRFDGVEIG